MGFTTRLFVAHPEGGWKRLPLSGGFLAWHAGLLLPEFADQTIVVVFAHVEMDRWRVIRLLRLEKARWKFDQAGEVDQMFLREEERLRFWPGTKAEMTESYELTAIDVQQIKRLLNI